MLTYLMQFVTPERQRLMQSIIAKRTRWITVALEDIYQPHNASAVLRSCDCFGIQDVHIIENRNQYQLNPQVSVGSAKWLTLHKYNGDNNNTSACITELKKRGYKIAATVPSTTAVAISDLEITEPIALLFGTEKEGLSPEALRLTDLHVTIPMMGFTESYNISVSAALCLYELTSRLHSSGLDYGLGAEEKEDILLNWARATVKSPELLEQEFERRAE